MRFHFKRKTKLNQNKARMKCAKTMPHQTKPNQTKLNKTKTKRTFTHTHTNTFLMHVHTAHICKQFIELWYFLIFLVLAKCRDECFLARCIDVCIFSVRVYVIAFVIISFLRSIFLSLSLSLSWPHVFVAHSILRYNESRYE